MTALTHGRNRVGRGTANAETARVRVAHAVLAGELGHAPGDAEIVVRLAAQRIVVTPERARVHLAIARLRAGEGADAG